MTGSARGEVESFGGLSGLRPASDRWGVNVRQGAAKAQTAPGTSPVPQAMEVIDE